VAWAMILLIELACSFAVSTNESCSSNRVALTYPDKSTNEKIVHRPGRAVPGQLLA